MKIEHAKRQIEALDADLSGSTFNDVNLSGATFLNVNFSDAAIHDAKLAKLRISNADLRGASVEIARPKE